MRHARKVQQSPIRRGATVAPRTEKEIEKERVLSYLARLELNGGVRRKDLRPRRTQNTLSRCPRNRQQLTSDLLDDVERWLATPINRRKAVDSARWLDFVDSILDMAVQRRQSVQELVKRFGPDIESR
jgi:hypothetical protein